MFLPVADVIQLEIRKTILNIIQNIWKGEIDK